MFPRLHCCLSHQTPGTYLTHPPPPCVTPQSPRNCASCKQPMYHLANYDIPIPCLLPPTAARHDLDEQALVWSEKKKDLFLISLVVYVSISRLLWLFVAPNPYHLIDIVCACGAPTKQNRRAVVHGSTALTGH